MDRPAVMPVGSLHDSSGQCGYGIVVGRVPIGDRVYADGYLGMKAARAMSKTNAVMTRLRN
eukprot:10353324-Karenia_brevis.AAC.1